MTTFALLLILAQQPTGTISGRVTDAITHQPIRSALVTTQGGLRDLSDDDGRFSVKHPAGADVQMRVAIGGYSPMEKTFGFADGDFLKLDVELHPLARIMGIVTDAETAEPIGRVMSVRRIDKNGGRDILSDKAGEFEVGDLEPGDYSVSLRQDNDAIVSWKASGKTDPKKTRRSYGAAAYPETIHIEEGERRFVEIRLPALEAHSVIGTIVVPAGREKEELMFTLWHLGIILPTAFRASGAGPFQVAGLTRGEYGLVAEMGKGTDIAFARQSFSITDHDVESIKLTLSPAASITGTVRMKEENASIPPKLEMWLNSASGWGSCSGFCMVMPSQSMLPTAGLVRIFQKPIPIVDGRFHADGIAPDDYWPELFGSAATAAGPPALRGLPDGYAVLNGDDQPIALYGGAQVDFVLTSKPGTIAGVVRDSNQAPVAGATVTLISVSDTRRQNATKSGQTGEFLFRNIAPGKYRVNGVPVEAGFGQTVSLVVAGQTP
jgi:hypothetical protein